MSVLDWLSQEARELRRLHPIQRARCWLFCESSELRRERATYDVTDAEVARKEQEHIERTGEFLLWERDLTDDEGAAREMNAIIASAMGFEQETDGDGS